MRIQHNIPALNSHRNLGINNEKTSKNLEKLSSGYRINRAGDDAAGLAISEKMRGQIRGLAQAEQNTSMGINLIQTAEGGLNETHAILQRMRELAVQSSNGTFQDSDRAQLTHEYDALKSEIDRIANSTHYNGIDLLNGNLGGSKLDGVTGTTDLLSGNISVSNTATAALADGNAVAILVTETPGAVITPAAPGSATTNAIEVTGVTGYANNDVISFSIGGISGTVTFATGDDEAAIATKIYTELTTTHATAYAAAGWAVADDTLGTLTFTAKADGGVFTAAVNSAVAGLSFNITGGSGSVTMDPPNVTAGINGTPAVTGPATYSATINGNAVTGTLGANGIVTFAADTVTGISFSIDSSKLVSNSGTINATFKEGTGLVFQIGANGVKDQQVTLNVDNMDSKSIGKTTDDTSFIMEAGSSIDNSKISDIKSANAAIEIIDGATEMVSAQRAKLGALQNRLEHTLNNLGVTKENLTASESTIRDVDMASEMMDFTKNSILVQAAQAMLAQANQLPQGVLQLLR